eukprot:scaffold9913_cov36-Cyclotella_meneghiniana.AAC.9
MKFTIPLSLLLLSSSSSAHNESNHLRAQAAIETTDQLQESSQQRNLQYATRKEGWLAAHNTRRESYHTSLGGTYVPLTWSKPLKRQALKYARQMASTCMPYVPTDTSYGVSSSARQGYPNLPTTNWVVSRWEENINDENKNYPMVQALWSKTEYVGCADSYNKSKKCSVSVCVYAKAGNCNMGQYDGWQDAIMNGPGCGACPPDVPNC